MGRARRLYRGRHSDGWLAVPRFEVGSDVYCKYQGCWTKGRVVAHHWKDPDEPKSVHPYQIKLDNGRLIYAPVDDEKCINRVPRFDVGSYVQCLLNSRLAPASCVVKNDEDGIDCEEWATGRVVAHHYEEAGVPLRPYQVQLEDGRLIYAPTDDDAVIKKVVFAVAKKRNDRRVAPSHVTPSWAMSTKNRATCACGCLPHEYRTLMKNALACWRLSTEVHKQDFVDLADDADTDLKSAQSEI